jgi:hypothetical protein
VFSDYSEATRTLSESVEIFRKLAETGFTQYLRGLRRNLEVFADHLERLGDIRRAQSLRYEAAAISEKRQTL